MKKVRALKFAFLGLGLAYLLPTACGSGGVVGGECRRGNCQNGAGEDGTGNRPGSGAANTGGSDGEGGEGRGASDVGGNGELPDGGFFDSPVDGQGDAMAPLECLPPHNVPSHCGDCDTQCVEPEPLCAPDGNDSFECVPECEPPLVKCEGRCVDPASFNSDPDNCGRCGNACPSDICQDGECVGAKYGHVALLCSDLNSANAMSSLTTLIGNAVFLPATNPVRVLAYTRGATANAVNRVNQVIGWAGMARGRTAEITPANTAAAVTSNLSINDYQVLLIHDLDQATSGEPASVAQGWETDSVLTSFTKAGGVVVVLNGGDGTAEMHELINAGNLLPAATLDGALEITGEEVSSDAPGDVLGVNVVSPFLASSHTCSFETTLTPDAENIVVLTEDDQPGGAPVAIHRVVAP
jgi:hypothetical protein